MTAIVHPSFDSGAEAYLIAGTIALAGGSKDYIVSSGSPSALSQQTAEIDEVQFNDFDETSSGVSLDVDIDPGEAFIFGAWVAFDTTQTVSLDASTNGQQVYLGWDESQPNRPIVGTSSAFTSIDQKIPLFTFDTDGSGVTSVTDDRAIGREIEVDAADLAGVFLSDDGSDNLTVDIGDGLENDGSNNIRVDEDFAFTLTSSLTLSGGATLGADLNVANFNLNDVASIDGGGDAIVFDDTVSLPADAIDSTELDIDTGLEDNGSGAVRLDEDYSATWTTDQTFSANILDGSANEIYNQTNNHIPRARLDDQWTTNSITTTATTANEEVILADTSGGAFTLTLATADAVSGNRIEVADSGGAAGANALTIDTEGAESIDGGASISISTNYGNVALVSDGTNWYTV